MPKSVNYQSTERRAVERSDSARPAARPSHPTQTIGQAADLEQWIQQNIARPGLSVQYRLRGNSLHLLCRQATCPERDQTLRWLIPILQAAHQTNRFSLLLPADAPPLYQVWLYGCQSGDKRPRWTVTLYLNQLEQQLEQLRLAQAASAQAASAQLDQTALVLSNRALAQRGEEMAIACYLSETLNELGVAVRVSAKVIPYRPSASSPSASSPSAPLDLLQAKRLWVACEAAYSPDPALLSQPITQKLRELEIDGFHDAVIRFQVTGESQPDWTLRVDLTPPSEMLRDWARWGDLKAIQVLLNQELANLRLQITTATVNATTLHLCCSDRRSPANPAEAAVVVQHQRAKAEIGLVLEAIAPQGIHAVTLYGQIPGQSDPAWIEWLDLPAAQHPAFAESTLTLAKQGDWEALAFLLHRLLNPNLSDYLASGGIRLQLLPKQDLLHVMCEAPDCPERQPTTTKLGRFLRQLEIPDVAGIRIYGRRSGQKQPLWSYGLDFVTRSRLVPEVAPEFAVTDALIEDLLPQPGQSVMRPDLTPADLQSGWQRWQAKTQQALQQILLRTQIFSFAAQANAASLPGQQPAGQARNVALVWGAAGLVLVLQTNWLLNQLAQVQLARASQQTKPAVTAASGTPAPAEPPLELKASPDSSNSPKGAADQPFNVSGFTQASSVQPSDAQPSDAQPSDAKAGLPYMPQSPSAQLLSTEILAEASPLPSFNSQQMDQKLQLYYRYVAEYGAPDVLIVGSSRALRGVDPTALEASLKDLGVSDAKIFNFGINGATAQVVNLLVQHLLTEQALPQMIIWADGARAFNSGAVDVTYNGILASAAYRELLAGSLPLPSAPSAAEASPSPAPSLNRSLTSSYESIDRWLSQQLSRVTGQTGRDPLKRAIQQGLVGFMPSADLPDATEESSLTPAATKILQADQTLPDASGFLSLPVQFNPATYYQKYARVLGSYDSDYENFRIDGNQTAALESLLKFTEASQIPLVFVNLPLTEDYLDPVRLEHEQQFRDFMVQLSLDHADFAFRDLSEQWSTQYRYFSDPSHLNRYGAYALSLKLAQDAKIPWRKSLPAAQTSGAKADAG